MLCAIVLTADGLGAVFGKTVFVFVRGVRLGECILS